MPPTSPNVHVAVHLVHPGGATGRRIGSALLVEPTGVLLVPPVPTLFSRRPFPSLRCAVGWLDDTGRVRAEAIDVEFISVRSDGTRIPLVALELAAPSVAPTTPVSRSANLTDPNAAAVVDELLITAAKQPPPPPDDPNINPLCLVFCICCPSGHQCR